LRFPRTVLLYWCRRDEPADTTPPTPPRGTTGAPHGIDPLARPRFRSALGDGRYVVHLTPECEAEQVDQRGQNVAPEWPSVEIVSTWVGKRVQLLGPGDGSGFEAYYRADA